MNTKENIIKTSMNLFSLKGYDAVSIRDIAKHVGIKGSSIYNHFENKEDILKSIVTRCQNHINYSLKIIIRKYFFKDGQLILDIPDNLFVEKNMKIFTFLLTDDYSIKLRKILTIEKFKNNKAAELFDAIYINNILNFQQKVFKQLIDKKIVRDTDPYLLSLEFYSPVFLLFYKRAISDIDNLMLEKHILDFKKYYMRG